MLLGFLGWVVIGAVVALVATKIVNLRGDDPRFGIAAGIVAAVVAGGAYCVVSGSGVTAWNPWSLICSLIGAVVGVVVWHLVRSRYISHEGYVPRSSY